MKYLRTPLNEEQLNALNIFEEVIFEGTLYTLRDRTHQKLWSNIQSGKEPFDLKNSCIYYCGPVFRDKKIISCGPTTSSRMDKFVEFLLKKGVKVMIGKGKRAPFIGDLCRKYKAVYMITCGGCGAYLAEKIKNFRCVAFPQLGPESIFELEVKEFPLVVAIDTKGRSIY